MSKSIQEIKRILVQCLDGFEYPSKCGGIPALPKFDYYSGDYLEFAEQRLDEYLSTDGESNKCLIDCVGHLKRALDCQIDCLLYTLGLDREFKKKNLGIYKKLDFVSETGIIKTRTVSRFVKLRNKVEHDFKKPIVSDIETLYDLVTALIMLIHNAIDTFGGLTDFEITVFKNDNDLQTGSITFKYMKNKNVISFESHLEGVMCKHSVKLKDYSDFAYMLKAIYSLNHLYLYNDRNRLKQILGS